MELTREEMKQEAVKRMRLIQLSPRCIKAFKENDEIWTSERGCLYADEEFQAIAKKLETEYGFLVYHMDHTKFEFGDCLSLFIVSKYKEEWEVEVSDLKDGYAFCYVENMTDLICSEFGTITFKPFIGGVVRQS